MSQACSAASVSKLDKLLQQQGLFQDKDGYVEWTEHATEHPRNWGLGKKAYNVAVVCVLEFWMTAISSSGTAASDPGREEYHISRTLGYFMFTSLYLLGQAIGSIVCSPISETFGRRTLYIASVAIYCGACAIVAAVRSDIAVCFGRFISGAASAIPATVAFGSFEDMHEVHARVWIVFGYTVTGNAGLVLGPIYSAYVSTYAGWRWVFYISTVVSGIVALLSFSLNESRTAYLLEKKVKRIRQQTGDQSLKLARRQPFRVGDFFKNALFRPLVFLATEPIVQCCSILMAISYSLIYGLTEGLTLVYTEFGFNQSTTSSLSFLPLLVGLFLDVFPRLYDQRKLNAHKMSNKQITPDVKVTSIATSCPALAIGLWIFAWTVPPYVTHVHWIGSMIGLVFVGYATNDLSYVLFGYLTDSYGENAASACSALSLSRTIMAAIFPLFTYDMYKGLGGNVATSIFAAIATVFCITPALFIRYGPVLRKMSRHAIGDTENESSSEMNCSPEEEKIGGPPVDDQVASAGQLQATSADRLWSEPAKVHAIPDSKSEFLP